LGARHAGQRRSGAVFGGSTGVDGVLRRQRRSLASGSVPTGVDAGSSPHARAPLGREDRTLALICPPGPVRRALEIAGVEDLLTIYASRDAAANALVPR
jgi:hypothetical protein